MELRDDARHVLRRNGDDGDLAILVLLNPAAPHGAADHGKDDHGDVAAVEARCLEARRPGRLLAVLAARVVRACGELAVLIQAELAGPVLRVHHDHARRGGQDVVRVGGHRALAGQLAEHADHAHREAELTGLRRRAVEQLGRCVVEAVDGLGQPGAGVGADRHVVGNLDGVRQLLLEHLTDPFLRQVTAGDALQRLRQPGFLRAALARQPDEALDLGAAFLIDLLLQALVHIRLVFLILVNAAVHGAETAQAQVDQCEHAREHHDAAEALVEEGNDNAQDKQDREEDDGDEPSLGALPRLLRTVVVFAQPVLFGVLAHRESHGVAVDLAFQVLVHLGRKVGPSALAGAGLPVHSCHSLRLPSG